MILVKVLSITADCLPLKIYNQNFKHIYINGGEWSMKKLLILIVGFSPLLIGYGINLILYNNMNTNLGTVLNLISVLFFLYWGVLGFVFYKFTGTKHSTLIICNLPAFIALILMIFQEVINQKYWANFVGFATQFFYLPALRVGTIVTPNFLHYLWQTCVVSFVLMIAIFYLGCYLSEKAKQNK